MSLGYSRCHEHGVLTVHLHPIALVGTRLQQCSVSLIPTLPSQEVASRGACLSHRGVEHTGSVTRHPQPPGWHPFPCALCFSPGPTVGRLRSKGGRREVSDAERRVRVRLR